LAGKKLTLVIIPSGGKQVLSLRVPRVLLYAGASALVVFLMVLVGGSILAIRGADRALECTKLTKENVLLKERLQALEGTIDGLTASVEESGKLLSRARVMANIDGVDDEYKKMGIGGPVFPDSDPLADYSPEAASLALDEESRLDELEAQCELQQASLTEILGRLEGQESKWSHTPSICPVTDGWTSSGFGKRKDPFTGIPAMHLGLDFSAPKGSPVHATADGVVISAGWQPEFGRTVEIDHGDGIVTRYAHNDKILVKRGQKVKRGQIISAVGRSGRATAPHLHYEVRVNGSPVNPWRYILTADLVVD
jgi:murein DD-endopeptidase MepM/ murein hydrolase activator NlpD